MLGVLLIHPSVRPSLIFFFLSEIIVSVGMSMPQLITPIERITRQNGMILWIKWSKLYMHYGFEPHILSDYDQFKSYTRPTVFLSSLTTVLTAVKLQRISLTTDVKKCNYVLCYLALLTHVLITNTKTWLTQINKKSWYMSWNNL